jgi:hypothetical protein
MNIFEGSRRVAKVSWVFIVIGFIIGFLYASPKSVFVTYRINGTGDLPERVDKCIPDLVEYKELSFEGKTIYVKLCLPEGLATLDQLNPVLIDADKEGNEKLAKLLADEIRKRRNKLMDSVNPASIMNDPAYIKANEATKEAIRSRWGLDKNGAVINYQVLAEQYGGVKVADDSNKFDPDVFLARHAALDSFKIPAEDEKYIIRLGWFAKARQAGEYLAGLIATLVGFWLFTWGMGWIVRGFSGIPRGQDSKPNTPLESK